MDALLTVDDVAAVLKVHPNTVYKNAKSGEIPSVKTANSRVRFIEKDIKEWLERRSRSSSFSPLLEESLRADLSLEKYDRLFLKGGVKMSPKGKTWNYPFGSVYLRLTKSGKERWHIYYRVDGRRVRKAVKGAMSRADAVKVLQVEAADAFRGIHGFQKPKKAVTVGELADLYLANSRQKRSLASDESRIRAHLKPFIEKLDVNGLTPLKVEEYRNWRLDAGVKRSTTNRELALLKVMFSKAIDWGLCSTNPVKKVRLFPENGNIKDRILAPKEEARLLEASPDHLRPILVVALNTGMRRGEILNLEWANVDLLRKQVLVTGTKSGKNRIIPINSDLLPVLENLKMKNGGRGYVFANPKTGKPLQDIKHAFETACAKAGVKNFRFHDCRHTFGTRLVQRGVDLITVRDLLGHSTVKVTERYTHSTPDSKCAAVEALATRPQSGEQEPPVHEPSTRKESAFVSDSVSMN
jgi:excisionase family DNA binding protein